MAERDDLAALSSLGNSSNGLNPPLRIKGLEVSGFGALEAEKNFL
jgi:hypothetical protein